MCFGQRFKGTGQGWGWVGNMPLQFVTSSFRLGWQTGIEEPVEKVQVTYKNAPSPLMLKLYQVHLLNKDPKMDLHSTPLSYSCPEARVCGQLADTMTPTMTPRRISQRKIYLINSLIYLQVFWNMDPDILVYSSWQISQAQSDMQEAIYTSCKLYRYHVALYLHKGGLHSTDYVTLDGSCSRIKLKV